MSFKVTKSHQSIASYDFLLVLYSNFCHIHLRTVYEKFDLNQS